MNEPVAGPKIFIWDHPSGHPSFLAIASSEATARLAIFNHPSIGEILRLAVELSALVAGPPTQIVEPEAGAAFVLNYEDRSEAQ